MKNLLFILILSPLISFGQGYTTTGFKTGYVKLKSGEKKEGEVNYRLSIPDRDVLLIKFKAGKFKASYAPEDLEDHGQIVLISNEKNNYKDLTRNFNPGYIISSDGKKLKGKVAGRKKEPNESRYKNYGPVAVKFANEKDEVVYYWANKKSVLYYVQNVSGQEKHYINVYDYFVEVGNPRGRFSYFKNPKPTHVNESATNLSKSLASALEEQTTKLATRAAAAESFKVDASQGKSLDEAVGNATIAAVNAAEEVDKMFDVENADDILYKEYFIVDNQEETRTVIYKKNINEVLSELLSDCDVDENAIKKAASVKELEDVMAFLEANTCD